ncbi:MAG: TetR/AcrR family transcriptional regulator [Actinomyces sp.]|nr:MAG: TetR/AcrR family transcriptional regulator [Actinomyces sp.]
MVAAAIELADEAGIEAVTIRRLADRLGARPMSLYHHVANKDDLLDAMVDEVFAAIEAPPADRDWRDALAVRLRSARRVLGRHPWAVALLESRRNPGPATLAHHDAVIACLRRGGFPIETTAHAYAVLDAFLYGFVIQEAALPATGGADMDELVEEVVAPLAPDAHPHLTELAREVVLQPGYDFAHEFEWGLDLLLDALERRRELGGSTPELG